MRIIRDYQFVSEADRGATAAIGNFDGVHQGHLSVIDMARAAVPDAPLGIVTFEPHPREYFAPDAPPFRLMSSEARAHRLEKLGVERLYELNFNIGLAALTPLEFARDVILQAGTNFQHLRWVISRDAAGHLPAIQSMMRGVLARPQVRQALEAQGLVVDDVLATLRRELDRGLIEFF